MPVLVFFCFRFKYENRGMETDRAYACLPSDDLRSTE